MIITGKTSVIGLIGNPIEHSLSPVIHNYFSEKYNLDYVYATFRVSDNSIEDAFKGIKALNISGINITVPHKEVSLKYMDNIDETAEVIGSVNTVVIKDNKFTGYNTDCLGFGRSLTDNKINISGKGVCVIGAGGASRAVIYQLVKMGAGSIHIFNRSEEKAIKLAEYVNNKLDKTNCRGFALSNIQSSFNQGTYGLIVNCTSVGMHPNVEDCPIPEDLKVSSDTVFYDIIYNPRVTRFLKIGQDNGCSILNGMDMLIYQAVYAYEMWTGIKIDMEAINELRIRLQTEY
jgi:shikimate dehydrogenase